MLITENNTNNIIIKFLNLKLIDIKTELHIQLIDKMVLDSSSNNKIKKTK